MVGAAPACATEIPTGALLHRGIHPSVDWRFFPVNYGNNYPLQAHLVLLLLAHHLGGVVEQWRNGNCSSEILAPPWAALLCGECSSQS